MQMYFTNIDVHAGVTLAKIDKVDKIHRCILLSACDLVHGTPVLDVKVCINTIIK